jgi:hypothetical protein
MRWQWREPLFRLPVVVPLVCAAATFVTVDHDADVSDLAKAAEPTIIAIITAVLAINGLLSFRGRAVIDYLGSLLSVIVLLAAEVVTVVQISGNGVHNTHVIAAAMISGLVTVLISAIRGANQPEVLPLPDSSAPPDPAAEATEMDNGPGAAAN